MAKKLVLVEKQIIEEQNIFVTKEMDSIARYLCSLVDETLEENNYDIIDLIAKARSQEELIEGLYKALRQRGRIATKAEEKKVKIWVPSQDDIETFLNMIEEKKSQLRKIALSLGLLALSKCFPSSKKE